MPSCPMRMACPICRRPWGSHDDRCMYFDRATRMLNARHAAARAIVLMERVRKLTTR